MEKPGGYPKLAVQTIKAAIFGGLRVALRSWLAMRWGKRQINKGVKIFEETLHRQDLPATVIQDLTSAYGANAELLSIRGLSKYAIQAARSRTGENIIRILI